MIRIVPNRKAVLGKKRNGVSGAYRDSAMDWYLEEPKMQSQFSPMEHLLSSGAVWATRKGLGWKGRCLEGGGLKQTIIGLPLKILARLCLFVVVVFKYLFICLFWLHWVLAAARGLFVAECRLLSSCGT